MELKHFKELDGLRGIAALMIIFFHFFTDLKTQNAVWLAIEKYAMFGQTGVTLFFVLSGFLITRILLNTKQSENYFKNFYIRRMLRIFPLYYLYLIIFYFIIPFFENATTIPSSQQIWYWVYLQNFANTFHWEKSGPSQYWSLAVEEHFYIVWPFIIYFLNIKKITNTIFFIIILAFIIRLILIKNNFEVYYFTFSRMDELAIGAFMAILEIRGQLKSSNAKIFLLLFCSIVFVRFFLWQYISSPGYDKMQLIKNTVIAFFYFSIIGWLITIKESNWFRKIFLMRILTYAGKISYGLYIYHPLCFWLLGKYFKMPSIFISFITGITICFVVASLSYYLFESKFLLLKKKFEYG